MEFLIEPITVIGYHGTSRQAAESILTEDFRPGEETWDWLGHGAYFWQDLGSFWNQPEIARPAPIHLGVVLSEKRTTP